MKKLKYNDIIFKNINGVYFIDIADIYSGDHRTYNRNGEAFDKDEAFSGVDYETERIYLFAFIK